MILETERLMQKTCGLRGCGARIATAALNQSAQEKNGFSYQWTAENAPVPQMGETRRGHVDLMTGEQREAARRPSETGINVSDLSSRYTVRRLEARDAAAVEDLCRENGQFYLYCGAEPTEEQILEDMRITPPGVDPSDKYYIGFFRDGVLISVMDLIDGYPGPDVAFIGFFMMKKELQGQNIGSSIVAETAAYLKSIGKTEIRLGIDKGNPQSTHFWKKNGFAVLSEDDRGGRTVLTAEKKL